VQLAHYKGKNVFDTWTAYHLPSVPDSTQRALIDTIRTKIDVSVEKSKRLGGTEEIEFSSLAGGPRLLLVQLAPTLRVSKISSEGAELKFIQEDKKKDASLWVITPKPLAKGQHCVWTIAYSGDEVISNAGEGNYFVGRRTSWYPKLDIPGDLFGDRAIYQLRFQSPKGFDLIATGKLKNRSEQGKLVITEWETEIPFPVVGFNFGRFKSLSKAADSTEISVYVNPGLNDELQGIRNLIEHNPEAAKAAGMMSGGLNTTGMLGAALAEAYNAVRLFTIYFGPLPFSNVSLSQQPSSSYGQSWPTLIFLPYTAFLDATTRNQLGLDDSRSERQFFEQVGPHEMAHQWWAHTVGTKSYHDEWLSEGFAEYSGGLYVQRVLGDKRFQAFLNAKREEILSPLPDTRIRANDAGPVYLGRRLSSEKTPGAYSRIVYAKGAFVLHMLRMLMYNFTSRDETPFITMMKEFTSTYRGRDASTEDFKAIVSKYFRGDMSWFFNQWVYGTEIPRITVQYSVVKNEKGALMQGTVTQRGVSPGFQTFMPVLVTLGQKVGRVRLSMMGEVPAPISIQLPSVPDSVEFNPLESVLCDLEVKKM
jgi:aminopeptidase N